MPEASDFIGNWNQLINETNNQEIDSIIEEVENDAMTVDFNSASKGLEYLIDLNENWQQYERPDWFHGTKSVNIEDILEEGLIPGSQNDSYAGERSDHPEVCMSKFGLAYNYARQGTPSPDQIQHHVDSAYELFLGRKDVEAPDISTEKGRTKFFKDTAEFDWGLWSPVPNAVENYQELEALNESDPVVVGVIEDSFESETKSYENKTEYELALEKGMTEINTDEVFQEEFDLFVPHEGLEDYREKYETQANILSIESMLLKLDHQNRDTYQKEGTIRYEGIWETGKKYPFTFGSEEVPYTSSPLIPDPPY